MATAYKDEWTEEKCLQLIREFRARPILWDQKNPFYFKKGMKPKAWQEIGDAIGICPDKCKHKMIILCSSFRREKAKIMHSLSEATETSHIYKSTWFAFKDMVFLVDKDYERKRQLNGEDVTDNDVGDESLTMRSKLLRNFIDTPTDVPPMKRCRVKRATREMHQKVAAVMRGEEVIPMSMQQQTPAPAPAPGPSQTPAERDAEIQSFTSFIGNKMKKYTDTTKNAVQAAICELIFKADQNYFEATKIYENFTIIDDNSDPLNREIYDVQSGTVIKVQNDSDDSE